MTDRSDPQPSTPSPSTTIAVLPAVVSGVLAGGAALGAGELAAAFAAPRPGPVVAVANQVIDWAPTWLVDLGKSLFGTSDVTALVIGTVILSLVSAAVLGARSRRSPWPTLAGIAGFGLVGLAAMGTDSQGGWAYGLVVTAVAVITGSAVFAWLRSRATRTSTSPSTTITPTGAAAGAEGAKGVEGATVTDDPRDPAVSRRRFLTASGTVGVVAVAAGLGANVLRSRSSVADARDAVQLADNALPEDVGAVVSGAGGDAVSSTPGISPLITPNDKFYLIDTVVLTPQIDPANWELTIDGMVEQDLTFSYQDLLDRATTAAPVTLSCVSNEVGGNLVGNAVWQGIPLTELLDEAGIDPKASQIASYSVDGWSCGFPTEAAYDGRTALVAVGMNDEPLPLEHGFPARLVVAGLYGYVSATKWLNRIELTTLDGFDGYWVPRGWSKLGPIKTQSRIDRPIPGSSVAEGAPVAIAGVAWSPDIGIDQVEVQIDDGPWEPAELGPSLGRDAWLQWRWTWESPTPGQHEIRCRATDADGETQTDALAPPAPSGATGWHTIEVTVS
ncbi:MAG: molybdopterin-dependent oxidoreductase [Acidimicrobiales bacterium]